STRCSAATSFDCLEHAGHDEPVDRAMSSLETALPAPNLPARRAPGWRALLWFPLGVSFVLFALPQASFIWMSLHRNLGFGRIGDTLTAYNYTLVLTDELYLDALFTTLYLSLFATIAAMVIAFPIAYLLVRTRWHFKAFLIDLLLVTALV